MEIIVMNRLRNDHMQHMPHFTKFMFQLIDDMITIGCRFDFDFINAFLQFLDILLNGKYERLRIFGGG